jgi:putative effector of murein hydrolase
MIEWFAALAICKLAGEVAAQGFVIGIAFHGIGTARALQVNDAAGAFAGLDMGLNALARPILLPALGCL